uniref:Uncharacterized protein n=1 Tax=Arundo donax TaxID=35708 RepID=A0A0A8ZEL3_ARUDO
MHAKLDCFLLQNVHNDAAKHLATNTCMACSNDTYMHSPPDCRSAHCSLPMCRIRHAARTHKHGPSLIHVLHQCKNSTRM